VKIRISYTLRREAPLYLGTPPITFDAFKSLDREDSSNSSIISLPGHAGSHIDLPRHFCKGGSSAWDMLVEENVIEPTYCCDIQKKPGESLSCEDLAHLPIPETAQALLIRTSFFRYRASDPGTYTRKHPWIHPDVAGFLRERFPHLTLFGIDTISISNPAQRSAGHEAHQSFLCEKPPIMLLEDLDLSQENLTAYPWRLIFYPLMLDDLDGVPVIAFLE
jgi:arylformamidase